VCYLPSVVVGIIFLASHFHCFLFSLGWMDSGLDGWWYGRVWSGLD